MLAIVVVNYNGGELLRACLASVLRSCVGLACEVLVVDNASADGSAEMVAGEFPQVRLIANGKNRGFAAACNQGFGASSGRYVLLLNSDVEVQADTIGKLLAFAESAAPKDRIGIVGCRLLNPDGTLQYSFGKFPTFASSVRDLFRSPPKRKYLLHGYDRVREVDWVTGACLLVNRHMVEEVGPMDERFFLYYEEVDWCRRARQKGWKVVYTPDAVAVHQSPHALRPDRTDVGILAAQRRSQLYYFRKHHPFPYYLAVAAGALALLLFRAIFLPGRGGRNRRLLAETWRAFLDLNWMETGP